MNFLLRLFVFSAFVANSVCLKNEICGLPSSLNNGLCLAAIPSWSYDGEKCVRFTFNGCGGNRNRFGSWAECEATCVE
ncbi:male accessory gland serine protease inhibitor-like isoform X2 [Drosophila subobscura]|uniref:male accessory gland serine protease inhibitor-like isoform X2 n=1 Tax=Drosophila subobscura TaxID=7241 RepID=UPI00155A840C|nr:male accessory gland serine protease inhibitor-like isoform X2 [Drosophila subobscura]